MTGLILAGVGGVPIVYGAFFVLAVKWRTEKERRAKAQRKVGKQ